MRPQKIIPFTVIFLALSTVPNAAHALRVELCIPDCASSGAKKAAFKSSSRTTVSGVTTTTFDLGLVNDNAQRTSPATTGNFYGFQFKATNSAKRPTIQAKQSGSVEIVIFDNVTVVAPTTDPVTGKQCDSTTTTTTTPCQLRIIGSGGAAGGTTAVAATPGGGLSINFADFPTKKAPGGYPSGVSVSGFFTGANAVSPAGDSISVTGMSISALKLSFDTLSTVGTAFIDPINLTAGGGSGDTAVSLPSDCTGSSTCVFTATAIETSFFDNISETVQHKCPSVSRTATTGQTTFAYVSPISAATDLLVTVNGTPKTLTTNYTVTGVGSASGNVVFNSGLAVGNVVVMTDRTCTPGFRLNVALTFKRSLNQVALPAGGASSSTGNTTNLTNATVPTRFADFTGTGTFTLGGNNQDKADVKADFTLNARNDGLNCKEEEVAFRFRTKDPEVTFLSTTFPSGGFHEIGSSGACEASITENGREWHIVINGGPIVWGINMNVTDAEFNGITNPITMDFRVGGDFGEVDLVTTIR